MTIFLISLGIFILINIFRIVLPIVVINHMANKHIDFKTIFEAKDFGIHAEHFFVTTDDGLEISAYEVSVDNPKAVIVCLSGMHYPSATAYLGHARLFRGHGFATVFFDMRAHGESDGNTICMGYKEHLDTKAILKYIKKKPEFSSLPVIVMGVSLGASTAMISAGEMAEIDGLISLSAFSSWEDIFCDKMNNNAPAFFTRLEKPQVIASTKFKYKVDSRVISPVNGIKKLGSRPALLMHSKEDSEVPFENFERLIENMPSHVESFIREGDSHLIIRGKFTEPEKDSEYTSVLLSFLDRNFGRNKYLPE
ncbi:MAG: alpha/beta hydrolase [Bacteroidia bacterium]|nr:alpha/beta hydrolase [Bacteroidia bacterium]